MEPDSVVVTKFGVRKKSSAAGTEFGLVPTTTKSLSATQSHSSLPKFAHTPPPLPGGKAPRTNQTVTAAPKRAATGGAAGRGGATGARRAWTTTP